MVLNVSEDDASTFVSLYIDGSGLGNSNKWVPRDSWSGYPKVVNKRIILRKFGYRALELG